MSSSFMSLLKFNSLGFFFLKILIDEGYSFVCVLLGEYNYMFITLYPDKVDNHIFYISFYFINKY